MNLAVIFFAGRSVFHYKVTAGSVIGCDFSG